MLKFVFILALLVAFSVGVPVQNFFLPIVRTTGGDVQGEQIRAGLFFDYFSFKGIPYGRAPIGDLRFKAPLPHEGWEGIRDGTVHGPNCVSSGILSSAISEDCLSLNVYTPNIIGRHSVMVWIHGGSFNGGNGDSFVYGPDHIIQEGVVIVTINYRLGILGFLSTDDVHATGNFGLKDCVLALKWIRDNILAFGGDPNDVTIFGESAGGAAVHYLTLSPAARGLFNKAISQSGSALNSWSFQTNPVETAFEAGRTIGIEATSTEELVAGFRRASIEDIIRALPGYMIMPIARGVRTSIPFVPTRDPPNIPEEEVFLPQNPIDIIRSGNFADVPYITGFTDAESLFMVRENLLDPRNFDVLNRQPELLVPPSLNVPEAEQRDVGLEIWRFYFGNRILDASMPVEYSNYMTDAMFAEGIDRQVQLQSTRQSNSIFYYKFSFDGDLNIIKTLLRLGNLPGAVHADDIFYLFSVTRFPPPLFPTNDAINTRRRMVRLWANFAKTGTPTPSIDPIIITSRWTPVMGTQEFLDIGTNLNPGRYPLRERMAFWNGLRNRYNS